MDTIRILSLVFLALFASLAHAEKPIDELIDVQIPVTLDGTHPSLDAVRSGIISGCMDISALCMLKRTELRCELSSSAGVAAN